MMLDLNAIKIENELISKISFYQWKASALILWIDWNRISRNLICFKWHWHIEKTFFQTFAHMFWKLEKNWIHGNRKCHHNFAANELSSCNSIKPLKEKHDYTNFVKAAGKSNWKSIDEKISTWYEIETLFTARLRVAQMSCCHIRRMKQTVNSS